MAGNENTHMDLQLLAWAGSSPMLWKNGSPQKLSGSGAAKSGLVSGKDVYVAGYSKGKIGFNRSLSDLAILWKNGVAQPLRMERYRLGTDTDSIEQPEKTEVGR